MSFPVFLQQAAILPDGWESRLAGKMAIAHLQINSTVRTTLTVPVLCCAVKLAVHGARQMLVCLSKGKIQPEPSPGSLKALI